jgi:pSer/pThr/pTyr-binding forkhead associated (FHA) protein
MGSAQIAVTVILNGRVTQRLTLAKDRILVGRSAESDVRINHVGVSRSHAAIVSRGGGVFVEDLESSNGTVVNGKRVRSTQLRNGDVVEIGSFALHVKFAESPKGASSANTDRFRDERTVAIVPAAPTGRPLPGGDLAATPLPRE